MHIITGLGDRVHIVIYGVGNEKYLWNQHRKPWTWIVCSIPWLTLLPWKDLWLKNWSVLSGILRTGSVRKVITKAHISECVAFTKPKFTVEAITMERQSFNNSCQLSVMFRTVMLSLDSAGGSWIDLNPIWNPYLGEERKWPATPTHHSGHEALSSPALSGQVVCETTKFSATVQLRISCFRLGDFRLQSVFL